MLDASKSRAFPDSDLVALRTVLCGLGDLLALHFAQEEEGTTRG